MVLIVDSLIAIPFAWDALVCRHTLPLYLRPNLANDD